MGLPWFDAAAFGGLAHHYNMKQERLIIGNAGKRADDAVTLDIDPALKPDVIHDLNITPLPFKDNQFKEITCHHVLEHLNDISPVLDELHRICRPNGMICIEVPHHSSWYSNTPVHKLRFNYFAMDGYIKGQETWLTGKKFKLLKKEITFHRAFRRLLLSKIFNACPMAYERFWTYIFPAENLVIWLRPSK